MPPKTVTCSICGLVVGKKQTLHVGEGLRACRTHEETLQKSEVLVREQKKEERPKEKRPKETLHDFGAKHSKWKDFIQNHCWCCCKKGIGIREMYYQALVGLEKLRLKGEQLDFLNMPAQVKKETGLAKTPTLVTLEVTNDISDHLHKMAKELYFYTKNATLCVECLKKLKLYEAWKKTMPEPTLEDVYILGNAYETSELSKHVLKDAVNSLEV